MSPTPFEQSDMVAMQQEAMKRVQEMQGRARRTVGLEPAEESRTDIPTPPQPSGDSMPLPQKQKQDNEKTLITLLLLILMAENASPELIFALLYLL